MVAYGIPVVFGSQPLKPLLGFPPGKVRLRIRSRDCVKARVKTADGVREFVVKEEDGFWVPAYETARNMTTK